MILFDLRCADGHAFEAWFKDSATFDQQAGAREIVCPICASREVSKALMAPAVAPSRTKCGSAWNVDPLSAGIGVQD